MSRPISLLVTGALLSLATVLLPAQTQAAGAKFVHTCGPYRYDVQRVVDGLLFTVTDGARTRTLFEYDGFRGGHGHASSLNGCTGDALGVVLEQFGRYSTARSYSLLDPSPTYLKLQRVGKRTRSSVQPEKGPTDEPTSAAAELTRMENMTQDEATITRTALIGKQQIGPEQPSALNDASYYVLRANGTMERRWTNSTWKTVIATDSAVCDNGTSYVLYKKQFAEENTSTSTHPASQFLIEQSGTGGRHLIPIPYREGQWRDRTWYSPLFGNCFNGRVFLFVQDYITTVSPGTAFVVTSDPRTSLPLSSYGPRYETTNGYYEGGYLFRGSEGVTGEARIRMLKSDGTAVTRKPIFFRDLWKYPTGTTMSFRLDPRDPDAVIVRLSEVPTVTTEPGRQTYYQEKNGVYTQVDRNEWEWIYEPWRGRMPTDLYVSPDKDMLTVRSYFLPEPMLLHGLTGKRYSLESQRIGPVELDGSRKIWYVIRVDGTLQTWMARVR